MVRSAWHRSLLLLLGTCALVLVASVYVHPGMPPARAGATDATHPVSSRTTTPECRASQLDADYRARDAAAGHRYGVVRLRNVGDRACVVQGYGGLSYVGGGDGAEVGAPADREPATAHRVVLAPGERALSRVSETVAGNYPRSRCHPVPVDGFRVYAPDATRAFFVEHATTGCAADAVHLLSHRPFHG
ncbi:DUF4232 domain-containing protein [Nocardioides okcheonensis]|uniref:DUF4232 domain-containing protein n=1 Tax=Nocardioides okcheonensis TaxID=2894081 RepID=UPI001E5ADEE3|nr:DUF4232 domain-containing protein [Nocardioides okcheonensis]UFN43669.1 DUF4232 domain-containing protein [Nocardioides okcheonensis]